MRIGFFDSGLGGLLVLKAVTEAMPEYDYRYYGDTAQVPYGDKSESEIYELTKAGVRELFAGDCALAVLACNTASAETLRRLQDEFLPKEYPDRRILGVIIPVVEEVVESRVRRAILIGTKRTVSSGKYHLELGKRDVVDTKIQSLATPGLVPLIEQSENEAAFKEAKKLIDAEVGEADGLILGCTHYIVLRDLLRAHYKDRLQIFAQDEIIPQKLKMYLNAHPEIAKNLSRNGQRNIRLTEYKETYDALAAQLLHGRFIGGE